MTLYCSREQVDHSRMSRKMSDGVSTRTLSLAELPEKSGFRQLQSLQTAPTTHIHPRSCRRRFPPAKIHTRTMHSPQIVHIFRAGKSTIPARHHPKFLSKTKRDPPKARNSPQLTTKTEQPFYPQEGGRSSAIDICISRKPPVFDRGPRSPVSLVRPPELRPRHPRRPANKNIRVILALLVLHAFRVAVMPRQRTSSK